MQNRSPSVMLINNGRSIARDSKGRQLNRFPDKSQRDLTKHFKTLLHETQSRNIHIIYKLLMEYNTENKRTKEETKLLFIDILSFLLSNPFYQLKNPKKENKHYRQVKKISAWLENKGLISVYMGASIGKGKGSLPPCIQATPLLKTLSLI